jgi:hypothetical protein
MFFISNKIQRHKKISSTVQKNTFYFNAMYIIKNYPLRASEQQLDLYLQQRYHDSLKNLCIALLFKGTLHETTDERLVLLFKDPEDDKLARLITYGNALVTGSDIIKIALNQRRR